MRRTPIVAGATVAGLAYVLTFHSHQPSQNVALGAAGGSGATGSGSNGSTTSPPTTSTTTPGPSGSSPAGTTPNGGSLPTSGGPATTAPAAATRSATGPTVPYGYGQLDVTVTMTGGKITAVTVPVLQTAEQYSQQLAQQVIPMLRQQVLRAQSASISGISGATYTSQAYATSVQAALKKLGG